MKMKTVSLLAGVAVPLILAGSVSGELLRIESFRKDVNPADIMPPGDTNIPGVTSLFVVNVYAVFSPGDAAASVIGVGGSAALGIPLQVSTRDGIFFQHPIGADLPAPLAPSGGLTGLPGFLALKHDSFVTIGKKVDLADQTNIIGMDNWSSTRLTGSPEVSWFVAGFPAQGSPGLADNPPDMVLIGQFTVANPGPTGGVIGEMFVNARHTNAMGVVEEITIMGTFENQLPAPGTLALLGVAGLMGSRRRRRR